ncbi:MAG: sulfatase-like hydrolase/transferase, partial [Bacteroidia bacterium]|nr:sulfatase-like hydrolase/transferase [Bacteroidia bacterium]
MYSYKAFAGIPLSESIKIFIHGLRIDASITGYLLIVPLLYLFIINIFKRRYKSQVVKWYTLALLILTAFISVADAELYRKWGSKVNGQVLVYFSHPKEMMLSSASSPVILILGIIVLMVIAGYFSYKKFIDKKQFENKYRFTEIGVTVILFSFNFLMIRGGTGVSVINQSMAYFSNKEILNTASVNSTWNALYYASNNSAFVNEKLYLVMPRQEAGSLFNSLKPSRDTTISIFNVSKPNIVVIMLESWTASAINSISGINNLTPGFDALVNEGLLFDSTYSSGNRTEKGLVAILSGFPAQPVTSIITEPDKTARLPALSSDLKKAGYSTAF